MGYCALLIPQDITSPKKSIAGIAQKTCGKLMSGLKSGGLSFSNATSVLKDTANVISEGVDTLTSKFSGIALTQLLVDGKITSDTAFDYFTQGFPQALGMSSVAMGFQSVEQFKNAIKNGNGVNVQQVVKSFQNFGTALSNVAKMDNVRRNVEGFQVVEVDAVIKDERSFEAETPDRRVESGQTYQEFIHNLPKTFNLNCVLQENRNYSSDDFEGLLENIRDRKIAINVILGDDTKKSCVLTSFKPVREAKEGFEYSLSFKHITVGEVKLIALSSTALSAAKGIVKNALNPSDTKTATPVSQGKKESKDVDSNLANSLSRVFL